MIISDILQNFPFGTEGCRSNVKAWKCCDLHYQNNLTARKSSDITQKHINARQPYETKYSRVD